jgi:predicted CXXCH cytochrome family protein
VSAMLLGARNAVAFFTRTAVQPAPLTVPIRDESCAKCHADTLTRNDFNNHFHIFLPRWQAADPKAAVCVDCHISHSTKGEAQIGYLERTTTEQICQNCHDSLGAGD